MAHLNQQMLLSHDQGALIVAIKAHGSKNASGQWECPYGVLFDKTANILEALNGTLRAAKKQKKITFDGELLMMPKDKDVPIVLLVGDGDGVGAKDQETLP
ncbi:hypothetical protein JCM6882_000424 [Rhodosporidiobolus microsporus]